MLEFLAPLEFSGHKFDRGSILFEFSCLREPENSRYEAIGRWLSERVEMVQIPTPSMLWRGKLWPDLFISNQLGALHNTPYDFPVVDHAEPLFVKRKEDWRDDVSLDYVSRSNHGDKFHEAFIEPLCRKIAGRSSSEIAAKYHRSLWLPLYWPQTLRARKSLSTSFFYPSEGYAGRLAELLPLHMDKRKGGTVVSEYVSVALSVDYCLAATRRDFSVLFIVDESPIYRITDMDECAGIDTMLHRLVVEYLGDCDVGAELERLDIADAQQSMSSSFDFTLPTLANVAAGWRPRPNINDNLFALMQEDKCGFGA